MQQKTHDTSFRASKSDWTLYNVKPAEKTSVQKTVVQKTNAARLLDRMGIRYELRQYEADPNDLAAETVAAKIGLPPEQVFKTLVARGDRSKDRNGIVMAVIPGDQELNLKALAAAAGERKIQLVPVKELQALTGYIRGGVTALAAKRDFPVYMDETIELFDVVSISAGVRGLQILIAPADYLRATKGRLAALGQPKAGWQKVRVDCFGKLRGIRVSYQGIASAMPKRRKSDAPLGAGRRKLIFSADY